MGYDNVSFRPTNFGGGGGGSSSFSRRKSEQLAIDKFNEIKRVNAINEANAAREMEMKESTFSNSQTLFDQAQGDRVKTEIMLAAEGQANMQPAYADKDVFNTKQYSPEIMEQMLKARDAESRAANIGVNSPEAVATNKKLMELDAVQNPGEYIKPGSQSVKEILDFGIKKDKEGLPGDLGVIQDIYNMGKDWWQGNPDKPEIVEPGMPNPSKEEYDLKKAAYDQYVKERTGLESDFSKSVDSAIDETKVGLPSSYEERKTEKQAVPVDELMNKRVQLFRQGLEGSDLTKKEKDTMVGRYKQSKNYQDSKNEQIARRKEEDKNKEARKIANAKIQADAIVEAKKIQAKANVDATAKEKARKQAVLKGQMKAITTRYENGEFGDPESIEAGKKYQRAIDVATQNSI